jgi:hypothetical protein
MRNMDTFVVRVWGSLADEGEETSLRGVVEHIASGRSDKFHDAEELISFLRKARQRPAPAGGAPDGSGAGG